LLDERIASDVGLQLFERGRHRLEAMDRRFREDAPVAERRLADVRADVQDVLDFSPAEQCGLVRIRIALPALRQLANQHPAAQRELLDQAFRASDDRMIQAAGG